MQPNYYHYSQVKFLRKKLQRMSHPFTQSRTSELEKLKSSKDLNSMLPDWQKCMKMTKEF